MLGATVELEDELRGHPRTQAMGELGAQETAGVLQAVHGFLPLLKPSPLDVALDAMLTEEGVVWDRDG